MNKWFTGDASFNIKIAREDSIYKTISTFYEEIDNSYDIPSNLSRAENSRSAFPPGIKDKIKSKEGYKAIQRLFPAKDIISVRQSLKKIHTGFRDMACPSEETNITTIRNDTISKLDWLSTAIESASNFQVQKQYYYVALQLVLSFFIWNGKANGAWGWENYFSLLDSSLFGNDGSAYKALPILQRLNSVKLFNPRKDEADSIPITRACLFSILSTMLSCAPEEMEVLLAQHFSDADLECFKDYCKKQRGCDQAEWEVLSRCLYIKKDKSGNYDNIGVQINNACEADDSKTIDVLFHVLKVMKDLPIGKQSYFIDQVSFTFSKYLNALSATGYFRHEDIAIQEVRKTKLLNCIQLLQSCNSSSPDYLFAVLEPDHNGRNRVDFKVEVVHNLVKQYYLFTATQRSSIGIQYLNWCTRNSVGYCKDLVRELICFDSAIWEKYAMDDEDSLYDIMNKQVFSRFDRVCLDSVQISSDRRIESDRQLIETIQKMFRLVMSNTSSQQTFLYVLFFNPHNKAYEKNAARMIVYLMHNPSAFCGVDRRTKHAFMRFIKYIIRKVSANRELYKAIAFREFEAWEALPDIDDQLACEIKRKHYRLFHNDGTQEQAPGIVSNLQPRAVPQLRAITKVLMDFRQGQFTTIGRKNEERRRILKRILCGWSNYTPEEQDECINFADESIKYDDPEVVHYAFCILDRVRDTSDERIRTIREFIEKKRISQHALLIYWINACLSHQIIRKHFSLHTDIIENSWQYNLLDKLFVRDNRNEYEKVSLQNQFILIRALLLQLNRCFDRLPLSLRISYIYFVRNDTDILSSTNFSCFSLADCENMDTRTCFDLWRFFCEIEHAKTMQLGDHSIEEISVMLVKTYFQSVLVSNNVVKQEFGEEWSNALYHLLRNSIPETTSTICAFVAFKIAGAISHSNDEDAEINQFTTQIKKLRACIFGHPHCYNLMTDVMKTIRQKMILSPSRHLFAPILEYINKNLYADEREWLDDKVQSSKEDSFVDMIVESSSIKILQERELTSELPQDISDYILQDDYTVPFTPAQPIIVVEVDGCLYAIENRSMARLIQHIAITCFIRESIPIMVRKWVPAK